MAHLLEVSWEVCNKVGGIYTVITSKLAEAQGQFGKNYIAIGPYLGSSPDFAPGHQPAHIKQIAEKLAPLGIEIHYGAWQVPGKPAAILLDWNGLTQHTNEYKTKFWEQHHLDTLGSTQDVDQPLFWSAAVGHFAQAYATVFPELVVLQLHEWLSAGALLTLEKKPAHIWSVFTTHATVLGRALSSEGAAIYDRLEQIDADAEARRLNVLSKHQLEKLGATLADRFTTVSSITGEEATSFLSRKPDVITENGLNVEDFPTFDALCQMRANMRESLDDFISAYFFPTYRFDLNKTVYQFTMGRYEPHNKGYDLYLESLGELNRQMKEEKSDQTIVSFFLIPADSIGIRPEVMNQLIAYKHLRRKLYSLLGGQQRQLFAEACATLTSPNPSPIMSQANHYQSQLLPYLSRLQNPVTPQVSPFMLRNQDNDAICQLAERYGLHNQADDKVKVVFFPVYFDGFDRIFNATLYEIITGCDLGVFPSYYEPWGYTPMEALAMGIPVITSTLTGFGRSITDKQKSLLPAVFLLDRRNLTDPQSVRQLTEYLRMSLKESGRQWINRRISAYERIQAYSWSHLYANYRKAYSDT